MTAAVTAKGLSKQYALTTRQPHDTLRDTITGVAQSGLSRLRRGGRGDGGAESSFWALDDISFTIQTGEVVGIVGRNGAGKSTLLKVLSRITSPTRGEALIRGRLGSLLEVGAGFHPELSGRENVYLNGAILGMKRTEMNQKFDAIVEFAEVERFIDTPVKRYSSGMYVRLAFAVAAHLEPDVLVVDEVLAVGDQAFQQKCLGRMEAVSADGRTVLFVSHSMSAIEQLCSRVIVLQQGCLVADGTPQDIIAGYLSQVSHTSVGPVDLTEVPRSNVKTKPIIHELTLRDGLGEPCGTFGTEEPMVIDFLLRPPFTLREPRLAAAVEETTGRRLTTVASYFTLDGLDEIDGPCRIRCTIPRLPLGPGRYLISISLVDTYLGTLDALDNIVSFDVEWRNGYGTGEPWYPFYGPVMTSSRWQRADGEDVLVLDLERERAGGR